MNNLDEFVTKFKEQYFDADEFDMAVKFIGVGEGMNDLKVFNPEEFVGGIFNE